MKIKVTLHRTENCKHFGVGPGDEIALDVEEYVRGVVPSEIGNAHVEACKAQAVAARTMATHYAGKGWAISDQSSSAQAYRVERALSDNYPNAREAVEATAGEVLTYDGKVLDTVSYSASNGGHTVSALERWPGGGGRAWLISQSDPWDAAATGGKRTGHGVGMSQAGAKYAAQRGVTYDHILVFYYPGAVIAGEYGAKQIEGEEPKEEEPMNEYPITYEPYTRNRCMTQPRTINPKGIVVHSVGCKGTKHTRWGAGSPWDTAASSKAAHALIDTDGIWQTLPWTVRCWLAAGTANQTHIQFEICEPSKDTEANAADLYGKTLSLCVQLCRHFGLASRDVICHREAHALGIANNHGDVEHWWGKKGTPWEPYTMDKLRADIAAALGEEQKMYTATVKTRTGNGINLWSDVEKTKSIAKIPEGARVTIAEELKNPWCAVLYSGAEGVCDGRYLIDRQQVADTDGDAGEADPEPVAPDIVEHGDGDKTLFDVTLKNLTPAQMQTVMEALGLA